MKLRHKTTTAVIGETQWNEDHQVAYSDLGNIGVPVHYVSLADGAAQSIYLEASTSIVLPVISTDNISEHLTLYVNYDEGPIALNIKQSLYNDASVLYTGTITGGTGSDFTLSPTPPSSGLFGTGYVNVISGSLDSTEVAITAHSTADTITCTIVSGVNADYHGSHVVITSVPVGILDMTWVGGIAPDFGEEIAGRNILVFTGTGVEGWVGYGDII